MKAIPILLLGGFALGLVSFAQAQTLRVTHLRCEYLENPIGIGEKSPRLSWWCESKARGDRQTACQILVASSPEKLKANKGDLWNTGKIKSGETTQIEYSGEAMGSRDRAWWKVRVWDKGGEPSVYSKPASWELGLLDKSDWVADWVGLRVPNRAKPSLQKASWIWYPEGNPANDAPLAPRYFRRTIHLDEDLWSSDSIALWAVVDDEATVYFNGKKIGDIHSFKNICVLRVPNDVVKKGDNVVAVKAWNTGGPAALRGTFNFIYEAPQGLVPEEFWKTDSEWRTSQTAPAGWQKLNFDDSNWKPAKVVALPGEGPWPEPRPETPLNKAIYIRKEIDVDRKLVQARLYATARGVYELFIDGKRVGRDVLPPGFTDYNKRIQFQTYDVTNLLTPGRHVIGAVVGDGWYVGGVGWGGRGQYGTDPKVLIQLELIDRMHLRQTYATDGTWQAATGPILSSDIMLGESYDARKELSGWCMPWASPKGWDDSQMEARENVPLVSQPDRPVEKWNELTPRKIAQPKRGTYVFDLGQNMVGWARLKVKGSRGRKIQLRFAEVLNPNGTIYTTNLRGAKATDTYICKGDGIETYEPSFTLDMLR